MRKTFLIVILLFAIVFGAFAQNGRIRELTGTVEIKPAGAGVFTAAKAGDAIEQNTIVSTGFKSTALITIGSSMITVRPLTRLSLADIQSASGTENINVSLSTGRVKVDVKPPAGTKTNMTIQGPAATASVRGTVFEFDTVNLTVVEGKVAFSSTSSGVPTMVQGGESSFVGSDGQPVSPTEVTTQALLPSAPVGSETSSGPAPSPSTGEIVVNLKYPEF